MPQEVLQLSQHIEKVTQNVQQLGPQFQNVIGQITQSLQPLVGQLSQLQQLISGVAGISGAGTQAPGAVPTAASSSLSAAVGSNNQSSQLYRTMLNMAAGVTQLRQGPAIDIPSEDRALLSSVAGLPSLISQKRNAEKISKVQLMDIKMAGSLIDEPAMPAYTKEERAKLITRAWRAEGILEAGAQENIANYVLLKDVMTKYPQADDITLMQKFAAARGGLEGIESFVEWVKSPRSKDDLGFLQEYAGQKRDLSLLSKMESVLGNIEKINISSPPSAPTAQGPYRHPLETVAIYGPAERLEAMKEVALGRGTHLQYDITDAPVIKARAQAILGESHEKLVSSLRKAGESPDNAISTIFANRLDQLANRIAEVTQVFDRETKEIASLLKSGSKESLEKTKELIAEQKRTAAELSDLTKEYKEIKRKSTDIPGGGGGGGGFGEEGAPAIGVMSRIGRGLQMAAGATAAVTGVAGLYTAADVLTSQGYFGAERETIQNRFLMKSIVEQRIMESANRMSPESIIKNWGDILFPGKYMYQGREGWMRAGDVITREMQQQIELERSQYRRQQFLGWGGLVGGGLAAMAGAALSTNPLTAGFGLPLLGFGLYNLATATPGHISQIMEAERSPYAELTGGVYNTWWSRLMLGDEEARRRGELVRARRLSEISAKIMQNRENLINSEIQANVIDRSALSAHLDFIQARQQGAILLGGGALTLDEALQAIMPRDFREYPTLPGAVRPATSIEEGRRIEGLEERAGGIRRARESISQRALREIEMRRGPSLTGEIASAITSGIANLSFSEITSGIRDAFSRRRERENIISRYQERTRQLAQQRDRDTQTLLRESEALSPEQIRQSQNLKEIIDLEARRELFIDNLRKHQEQRAETSYRDEYERYAKTGVFPVIYDKAYISSGLGMRRIMGEAGFHSGIDIAAPIGTPVLASHAGVVERVYGDDRAGRYITIRSGDFRHKYMHLGAQDVKEGDIVKAGQIIGTVGQTGRITGAHLHYQAERLVRGRWVPFDPRVQEMVGADPAMRSLAANLQRRVEAITPYAPLGEYDLASERGLTIAQFAQHANLVASVMGHREVDGRRVGIRAAEVIPQAAELIDMGRSGLGSFQQLLGNLAGLNVAVGGQNNLQNLKTILAEAVSLGFNKSHVAQEMVRNTTRLAEISNLTRIESVTASYAAAVRRLGVEEGVADERSMRLARMGMEEYVGWSRQAVGPLSMMRMHRGLVGGGTISQIALLRGATTPEMREILGELEGTAPLRSERARQIMESGVGATPEERRRNAANFLRNAMSAETAMAGSIYELWRSASGNQNALSWESIRAKVQKGMTQDEQRAVIRNIASSAALMGMSPEAGINYAISQMQNMGAKITPEGAAALKAQIEGGRSMFQDPGQMRAAQYSNELLASLRVSATIGQSEAAIRKVYGEYLERGGVPLQYKGRAVTREILEDIMSGKRGEEEKRQFIKQFGSISKVDLVRGLETISAEDVQSVKLQNVHELAAAISYAMGVAKTNSDLASMTAVSSPKGANR